MEKTGRELAVKKLYQIPEIDDTQFKNEFNNLTKIQHPNTVRLIGYCYEVHNRHVEYNGEYVFGKTIYRVLCFEYLQNGSLDEHLYGIYFDSIRYIKTIYIISSLYITFTFVYMCRRIS